MTDAVRKKSFRHDYPGVIVTKCVSVEENRKIMTMKSELRNNNPLYKTIHIDNHKDYKQRLLEANLRTITNVVGNDKLIMKGARVTAV